MQKKYDYHSLAEQSKLMFVVWIGLLLLFLIVFLNSKNKSINDLVPLVVFISIGIGISILTYLQLKKTYIEITAEGILYNSLIKKINSPWQGIREIKNRGRVHKIYTINGNFTVGSIEPSGMPCQGWIDLIKRKHTKYSEELIEEIKRQAPHAKRTFSIFMRPL
jgi:hypothetical protein